MAVRLLACSVLVMLASAAVADQILLDPAAEPFYAGSSTNKLFVRLVNPSARRGLQFNLIYDPAVAEPIDFQGAGRLHDPVQLYHAVSPPGVLHVLAYDEATRAPLEVGADAIACITFAIPEAVAEDTLRVSLVDALAASDALASVTIAPQVINIPIRRGQRAPARFELYQNAPNPFMASTLIRFDVTRSARVRLAVYDLAGKLVRVLRDETMHPGSYAAVWDGRSSRGDIVASGIYFYVAQMGRERIARKAIRSP